MAFLKDKDRQQLQKEFENLNQPVKLVLWTQETNCQSCSQTRELLAELAGLSDKLTLEVQNLDMDKERAAQLGIDKAPAITVENGRDYGIRLFGIPSGYEFGTLIGDILMVSQGDSGLDAQTRAALKQIDRPVHFQVFVTPTCPYCPRAVLTAHRFALENEFIRADMVEANEFPELSAQYDVMAVPRVVINDAHYFEGALPEKVFALAALQALGHDTRELEKSLDSEGN